MSVYAEDILSKVSDHDLSVIKVLNERDSGFTKIQIAKKLNRSLDDVSHSIHRLKVSKHVKDSRYYGRVYLVDFDYSEQIANKRPDEAAMTIKQLQQDRAELVELVESAYIEGCHDGYREGLSDGQDWSSSKNNLEPDESWDISESKTKLEKHK